VVCTAAGVEARVGPVAEITIHPGRHVMGSAHASFEVVGAGEGLEEELVTLSGGRIDATPKGWDHVVALLVVVVAE
jgi:hypothetical protein